MKKPRILRKLVQWSLRYLPAEAIGTITAMLGAFGAHYLTDSLAAAAIAGSIAETVGFYSYFTVRDGALHFVHHKAHTKLKRVLLTSLHTVRDMLIEFGPAEALDSLCVRPLFMYLGPHLLHNFGFGLLLGKLAADVIFYVFAVCGYEIKQYWRRR